MHRLLLVLILALGPSVPFAVAQASQRIVAGPVQINAAGLSGTFHLRTIGRGDAQSPGTGGACLVFSERRAGGVSCRADRDCVTAPPFENGSGYCVRRDNSREGRCWLRPAETPETPLCRRSPAVALPTGERLSFPLDAAGSLRPVARPKPGWWRVHACLNLTPGACANPAGHDRQTDDGPPRLIHQDSVITGKPRADTGPPPLATVVVTARQRKEDLQQTPVSVTSLDAAELQSRGADDLSALGAMVPNLTVYAARPFNNAITAYIRGVGQSETVWGVEPGVGVYVDDVYLARPQAALLDILDVERIEVLRGPQGTLYGRNTIGGAIKYLTRPVDDGFAGNVAVTLGNFRRHDIKAVLNLPLGEKLRARAAVASFNRDGFGKNLLTGDDVSARDAQVARVAVDWSPHDRVNMRLAYDRYRDRSGARGAKRLAVNPNDPAHTPPDDGNFDVRSGMANLDDEDAQGWSATVDWDINDRWRLKSVSARRLSSSVANVDFDALPLPIIDLLRSLFEAQTSQEIRLTGSTGRRHLLAGVYLFDGEAGGTVGSIGRRSYLLSEGVVKTRSAALYADLGWDLSDWWSVEGGLRYTRERKTGTVLNQGYTDASFRTPNGLVLADFTDAHTFASLSPRLNVSRRFNEHAMAYAQASRGFKAGGYNIRANTLFVPESAQPFRPETATAYELGIKSDWLESRLTANAAVFHTLYRDIQLSVFTSYDSDGDGVKDAFFGDFKNAGAGTISGADLEVNWRPGRGLRWLGHVGYLDPRYDEYISGGVNIANHQRFTNAPRWSGGLSAIADMTMAAGGVLTARVDASYQSKVYPTTDLSEYIAQNGYALWNASLTWRSPKRRWELVAVGQNLSNRAYRTTGYDIPVLGLRTGFYGPPRTVSVTMTWFFP